MKIKEKDIDKADRFLRGEMSDHERFLFEERLNRDLELKTEVENLKAIQAGIQINELSDMLAEMEEWDTELAGIKPSGTPPKKNSSQAAFGPVDHTYNGDASQEAKTFHPDTTGRTGNMRRNMLKIAATILVLAAVTFWWTKEPLDKDDLVAKHFVHYATGNIITRSEGDGNISVLKREAFGLYEFKQYALAAPKLEQVFSEERDTISLFFAGVAYLGMGDLERSEAILTRKELDSFHDRDLYLRIIAKIKQNQ